MTSGSFVVVPLFQHGSTWKHEGKGYRRLRELIDVHWARKNLGTVVPKEGSATLLVLIVVCGISEGGSVVGGFGKSGFSGLFVGLLLQVGVVTHRVSFVHVCSV
jgi:hypothetical protein